MLASSLRVAHRYLEAKYDPFAPQSSQEVLHTHLYTVRPGDADDLNKDVRGEVSPMAALMKRARAWSLADFTEYMERYAWNNRIDELRNSLDERPLQYRVLVRGRVKDRGNVAERDIPRLREVLADNYKYEKWKDEWELDVKPRPKSDYRKLDALLAARKEREQAWAKLYADLRKPQPEIQPATTGADISFSVVDREVRVGGIQAMYVEMTTDRNPTSMGCWDDIRKLADVHGEGEVWAIPKATMWPEYRGKGVGTDLYMKVVGTLKGKGRPVYLEAHECLRNQYGVFGATSDDAKRVWKKLVSRFPSSGTVIAIL